jgi:tetratricopeptide (TPR) repeat protein
MNALKKAWRRWPAPALGLLVAVGLLLGGAPSALALLPSPPLLSLPLAVSLATASMGPDAPTANRHSADPSLPRLFDQALTASRDGRFGDALPLWDRVLELAPEDASAWSNRGNVLLALGDPEAAIANQDRAMQLDPTNADPHLNRGTSEEALGRWDAAAADYHWVLERDPADASALYNLGNVAGSLGDWAAARACFEKAALARPGFAMARSSAALATFQQGEPVEAERQLRNLIRRYPLFADARAGLTALLWSKGARGEAESNWAAASGLDPRYRQGEWLQQIRRWPPTPIQALDQFLRLDS